MTCENVITIYRNYGVQIPVQVNDVNLNALTVTNYGFAFIIAPNQIDGSLGPPVLTCSTPTVVEPGLLTFAFSQFQTATLQLDSVITYKYYILSQNPYQSSPAVNSMGRIKVKDAPVMPVFTPV